MASNRAAASRISRRQSWPRTRRAAERPDLARTYLALAQQELAAHRERWPEPWIIVAKADALARSGGDRAAVVALLERAEALALVQGANAVARGIAATAAGIVASLG